MSKRRKQRSKPTRTAAISVGHLDLIKSATSIVQSVRLAVALLGAEDRFGPLIMVGLGQAIADLELVHADLGARKAVRQ